MSKEVEYIHQVNKLKNELEATDDGQLNSQAIYLYFMQMGFDMYTGEKISEINDVLDSKKYDIDHIIPQSLMKDDSLDNKVLVSREINKNIKKNIYPIHEEIRRNDKVKN